MKRLANVDENTLEIDESIIYEKNGEEKEITIYEIVLDLDNFDTLIHCGIRSLENEGTSIDKWFNSKEFFNEIKN